MANSKYEYVKGFEVHDEIMLPNLIVARVEFNDFRRFSDIHKFEKHNDEKAQNLMNSCAIAVLEKYPDIVFSYGFNHEYSFVFKKESTFYRRASKILSLVVSFFTAVYVTKWKEYFPQMELTMPPSFQCRVIGCASSEVLQAYLAWRQNDCHVENQYNTCFWSLIDKNKCGKDEKEAHESLKGTQKQDKHDLLFLKFDINYAKLPAIFRQGSCVLKAEVEDVVKHDDYGNPVKRLRKKVIVVHSGNIASRKFWNGHKSLLKNVGSFNDDIKNVRPEYVKSFQFENTLMPCTWIMVRIDGSGFHRFCDAHKFEKPNDEKALNLMNACAVAVLEKFQDIIFAYGVSDEYSFVLKKDSQLYQRRASVIVSVVVSYFTSMYIMRWKEYFPQKELKSLPYFDGRAVCYPTSEILKDYFAWRQVDCHINNQYNTCFWNLVESYYKESRDEAQSRVAAQKRLKGTGAEDKYKILGEFSIDYHTLPIMFRQGSCVFWDKERGVVVEHCNIIDQSFWKAHSDILDEVCP